MRIFNEDKTQELNEETIDLEKGYLKLDKLFIAHHEAVESKDAVYADRVVEEAGGGISVYKDLVSPAIEAKEAYDEYEDIQVFVHYTEEELTERFNKKRSAELKAELVKIKEDIEQENFGLIRDDYAEKKARAAEIINELRVIEGKSPREVNQ